jgi:pilus assembly protein CpaB
VNSGFLAIIGGEEGRLMGRRTIVVATLCGLLCAGCVFAYVAMVHKDVESARTEVMEKYGGDQVEVLVATRDLYPGEAIDVGNTAMKLWVSDLLPEGAITKPEKAMGSKLTSMVLEGEAISDKRFRASALAIDVPKGTVALSVPAKDVQAVGGSLSAGNRVDVYSVGTNTTLLGAGILVLATSASGDDGVSGAEIEWVTLAVAPEKVEEFVAASESLEIYFALPYSGGSDAGASADAAAGGSATAAAEGSPKASGAECATGGQKPSDAKAKDATAGEEGIAAASSAATATTKATTKKKEGNA